MTRVMFPYILCMSLIAFASGVLNTWRRFAVPAFTPVLLLSDRRLPVAGAAHGRAGIRAGHRRHGRRRGATGRAMGALARLGLTPRFSLRVREPGPTPPCSILKQMAPATLGVSVAQISLLINTNIATWLTPGSVTWLASPTA